MLQDTNHDLWENNWSFLSESLGLKLSEETKARIRIYFDRLSIANQNINLTGLKNLEDLLEGHLKDTAHLWKVFGESSPPHPELAYLDLGSGCGVPGIILHLLLRERIALQTCLCENRRLRVIFLDESVRELALSGEVKVFPRKAQYLEEKFDLITARAIARPIEVLEMVSPLLKRGGHFMAQTNEPLQHSKLYLKASHQQGLRLAVQYTYQLNSSKARFISVLTKI